MPVKEPGSLAVGLPIGDGHSHWNEEDGVHAHTVPLVCHAVLRHDLCNFRRVPNIAARNAHNTGATTNSPPTVVGYNVYHSTGSSGSLVLSTPPPVTTVAYTNTMVVSGTTYSYIVKSVDVSSAKGLHRPEHPVGDPRRKNDGEDEIGEPLRQRWHLLIRRV